MRSRSWVCNALSTASQVESDSDFAVQAVARARRLFFHAERRVLANLGSCKRMVLSFVLRADELYRNIEPFGQCFIQTLGEVSISSRETSTRGLMSAVSLGNFEILGDFPREPVWVMKHCLSADSTLSRTTRGRFKSWTVCGFPYTCTN